jgi:hypothetical protein
MWTSLLIVTVLGEPGAEPAAKPDAGPKADAAVPPPSVTFTMRPTNFQISQYVNYDDKGEVQNAQFNCHLSVQASYKSSVRLTGIQSIEVTKIVTDTGQEVAPVPQQREYRPDFQRNEAMFHMMLTMPPPPARAKSYAEITGKIKVSYGEGEMRYATIGPWKDVLNHTIRVEGLAQPLTLMLRGEPSNRRFRLEYPRTTHAVLDAIRAQDGHGRDLRLENQGSGYSDAQFTRYLAPMLPDDGYLVISFYSRVQDAELPFTITNVALPQPPSAKAELVVQATPKPQRVPAKADEAGKQLKVIVE